MERSLAGGYVCIYIGIGLVRQRRIGEETDNRKAREWEKEERMIGISGLLLAVRRKKGKSQFKTNG